MRPDLGLLISSSKYINLEHEDIIVKGAACDSRLDQISISTMYLDLRIRVCIMMVAIFLFCHSSLIQIFNNNILACTPSRFSSSVILSFHVNRWKEAFQSL